MEQNCKNCYFSIKDIETPEGMVRCDWFSINSYIPESFIRHVSRNIKLLMPDDAGKECTEFEEG